MTDAMSWFRTTDVRRNYLYCQRRNFGLLFIALLIHGSANSSPAAAEESTGGDADSTTENRQPEESSPKPYPTPEASASPEVIPDVGADSPYEFGDPEEYQEQEGANELGEGELI